MRKHTLQHVNVLLDSLFKNIGISDGIKLEKLRRQWRIIFAGPLSLHTLPSELKAGRLVISVDSPAWLQHLKFLNKEILDKISSYGIKTLHFRLGSVHLESERNSEKRACTDDFRDLTDDDIAAIKEAVSGIDDDELKTVIEHAMRKAVRRKMDRT